MGIFQMAFCQCLSITHSVTVGRAGDSGVNTPVSQMLLQAVTLPCHHDMAHVCTSLKDSHCKTRCCEHFSFPLAKTVFDVFTILLISFFYPTGCIEDVEEAGLSDHNDYRWTLLNSAHFSGWSNCILRCHCFWKARMEFSAPLCRPCRPWKPPISKEKGNVHSNYYVLSNYYAPDILDTLWKLTEVSWPSYEAFLKIIFIEQMVFKNISSRYASACSAFKSLRKQLAHGRW